MRELREERGNSGEHDALRGQHLERLGRHEDALTAYRDALARDPHNAHVLRLLAYCQLRSEKEGGQALDTIDQAIALEPGEASNHVIRALILVDQRKANVAREAAEKAIELEPEASLGHAALAQAYMKARAWHAAELAAKKALSLDPDDGMASTILAHALFCQGKQVENQGHVARMLHQNPEDPFTHHAAGLAALQAEEFNKAEQHFLEALRLNPEFESAREGLLDAFRARSFLYRSYLRYAFFITRLSPGQRMGLLFGVLLLVQVLLRSILHVSAAVALAVGILYLLFVVWTYVAGAVGSLIVFRDRRARQALKPWQRFEALSVGGGVIAGILLTTSGFLGSQLSVVAAGGGLIALTVPLVLALNSEPRRGRFLYGSLAISGVLGWAFLLLNVMWSGSGFLALGLTIAITVLIISTWCAAFDVWRD